MNLCTSNAIELEPAARVTAYEVSCLPADVVDADCYVIDVERRTDRLWAVRFRSRLLSVDDTWDYGPDADSVDRDRWLATHRFYLHEALERAKRWAPLVTVNGYTAAQHLAAVSAA